MENISRRSLLKGIAAAPVVGAVGYAVAHTPAEAAPVVTPDYSDYPEVITNAEGRFMIDYSTKVITVLDRVRGSSLYSAIKRHWYDDDTAITYEFPMIAITPELITMDGGWKLHNVHFLQNCGVSDDGYGNSWVGAISLGQVFKETRLSHTFGSRSRLFSFFSQRGHVNEAVPKMLRGEFYVKGWQETVNVTKTCGFRDLSKFDGVIRFPIFEEISLT